ncbi:unnamed protein product, partial [Brenthis ino]
MSFVYKILEKLQHFQYCDTPLVARGASREGSGSVGSVKGPFDVCRRLNAPPAGPAPLIISNFPVIQCGMSCSLTLTANVAKSIRAAEGVRAAADQRLAAGG